MTLAIHCPPAQTNSRWSMQTYHRSSRPHEASIPQSTPALKQLLRVGGWVDLSTQQISNLLEIAGSESTTSEWQVRQSTTESHLTTRPLDYWTTRPLDHWTTGSLDHWTTGSLDHWTTGPLHHWFTGPLDHWTTGPLDHWITGRVRVSAWPSSPVRQQPSA